MDKKKLLALIAKKNERKNALVKQAETCEDVATLRSLNSELDTLNEEIRSLQELADSIPDEDGEVIERTAAVNEEIPGVVVSNAKGQEKRKDDGEEDMEYRKAFQQFVLRGTPIPSELRAGDENTLTTDVASAVPTILVNRIVEKLENVGKILNLVTKTAFKAGIKIPTSSVKPVATWVNEGAGSDRQRKTTSYIGFTNYKLRCEISMSMEVGTMALSAFENAFVKQVSEAMVKAIEAKIVSTADGTTGMKGILAETPATGQALTAKKLSYELLCEAEGALPEEYEGDAVWCMSKKTFMSFVGMTDAEGQPIARINYGLGGKPERYLNGRPVITCNYVDTFTSALAAGKIFAFIFNFADYAVNTVYDMGIQRKQDWDTEDLLTKAVMSVDGKVIDKNSLVTIAKSA
jgi:HK97 family phage major capsid protein